MPLSPLVTSDGDYLYDSEGNQIYVYDLPDERDRSFTIPFDNRKMSIYEKRRHTVAADIRTEVLKAVQ